MHPDSHLRHTARIDAHHHLWQYTAADFGWLDGALDVLRRDFLLADLQQELASAQVDGSVVVQARQTLEETEWLLQLAEITPALCGVVGWLPIASSSLELQLERLSRNPYLKGLRHVVQAEPDGFLDAPLFNAGISRLKSTGLVYDILIVERQLAEAIRFVDRHPSQAFVLDHIGKPRIAAGEREPWHTQIRELARRPNVSCKLSGMVTEADPRNWKDDLLRPYADVVLDAFGPNRVMIGTDWPVLTAGCSYAGWWQLVEHWISALSSAEQAQILGATATAIYDLSPSTSQPTLPAPFALQGEQA